MALPYFRSHADSPYTHLLFNKSRYNTSTTAKSHGVAREDCESKQSHLLFIENEAEKNFMLQILKVNKSYWLGVQGCSATESSFWDDGSPREYDYLSPQRMMCKNRNSECYIIRKLSNQSIEWKVTDCLRRRHYVCEYEGKKSKLLRNMLNSRNLHAFAESKRVMK